MYSEVKSKEQAKHGVGFIIHPDTSKKITNIQYHSERIKSICIKDNNESITYIQIYAPCNTTNNDEDCEDIF
jgi:hypothetical protein